MLLFAVALASSWGPFLDPVPPPRAQVAPACPAIVVTGDGSFVATPGQAPGDGRFDWPVGPPDGDRYHDAQPFGTNRHLGADLNFEGPDLGLPVYAVADGCVVFAEDIRRGWGNVVRVVHVLPDGTAVESLYAHLDRIDVDVGRRVRRGEPLGTIGDAHGAYRPHLHLELRTRVGMPQGGGYGFAAGYVDPIGFIEQRRGDRAGDG